MRLVAALLLALALSAPTLALPRDQAQRAAFRKANPCPSTGLQRGPCPGWQIDHKRALMNGGEDTPENMQWLAHHDHRRKTLADFAECRASTTCKYRAKHRAAAAHTEAPTR